MVRRRGTVDRRIGNEIAAGKPRVLLVRGRLNLIPATIRRMAQAIKVGAGAAICSLKAAPSSPP